MLEPISRTPKDISIEGDKVPRRVPWAAGIGAISASLTVALWYLSRNDWFGLSDLKPMITWTLPFGAIEGGLLAASVSRIRTSAVWLRYLVAVAVGSTIAAIWTLLAMLLLGGWIAAFSFPVALCWLVGGAFGGVVAAFVTATRTWPAAAVLSTLVFLALLKATAYAEAPQPTYRVVIRAGASQAAVDSVWTHVLSRPTGRVNEHAHLPGFRGIVLSGQEGESVVLEFVLDKSLSLDQRNSIVATVRSSSLVTRVDELLGDIGTTGGGWRRF